MNLQKLAKVLALAASDNDVEAVHALRTARRLLEAQGADFVSLADSLAGAPRSEADGAAIDGLEDLVFDLRAEVRKLRVENDRLKTGESPASPGLAHAAELSATAIRLRAQLAEMTAQIEAAEQETLRLAATEANLNRQLEDQRRENRRLGALTQALQSELEARRPPAPPTAEPRRARPKPGNRSDAKPLKQYALF